MIVTIYDVDTGQFQWTLDADPASIDAQTEALRGWVEGEWDASTHYVVDDHPVERPGIAVPTSKSLSVGEVWTIPSVPDGTQVIVDGEDAGEIDHDDPTIVFDTPGIYLVQLVPPFPYQPASIVVTVT